MSDADKALERLHTDASGVPGPDPASGKIWLNDGAVVNRIIRDFAAEVLRDAGRPGFMDRLAFECRCMNGLFMGDGESDKYLKGPWNRPDQIGEFVLLAMQINGETHNAVRDAFMVFSHRLLKLAHKDGFDESHKADIDGVVRELRDALIGVTGAVSK